MAGAPDYRAEKGNMNLLKIRNFKTTTWGNDDSGSLNSAVNTVQTKGDIAIISYKAMSRQDPNDVGEEASDQSMYF